MRTCELGLALGLKDLHKLPGCWEHQVDEHWWLAFNAHGERGKCSQSAGSSDIPAFTIYFEFNGWPAGMVGPDGGTLCAGAAANEDKLIEALDAAIALATAVTP